MGGGAVFRAWQDSHLFVVAFLIAWWRHAIIRLSKPCTYKNAHMIYHCTHDKISQALSRYLDLCTVCDKKLGRSLHGNEATQWRWMGWALQLYFQGEFQHKDNMKASLHGEDMVALAVKGLTATMFSTWFWADSKLCRDKYSSIFHE